MLGDTYPSCPDHPYAGFKLENRWGRCVCPKCNQHVGWVKPIDPSLLERPACAVCNETGSVHLMRTIQINGNSLVYWHCETCGKYASQPLPHVRVLHFFKFLKYRYPDRAVPFGIEDIRTRVDYRADEPCYVCGCVKGTEYHHFLPRVFRSDPRVEPNWQRWNDCGVRLCRNCHELWHELVAPMDMLASAKDLTHAK